MAYTYAISDPHGCLDVLERALGAVDLDDPENTLYLLGDYIPHRQPYEGEKDFVKRCATALEFVKGFCDEYPDQVFALKGNHEYDLLDAAPLSRSMLSPEIVKWLGELHLCFETDRQIFVHAGIDEEAGEEWMIGTGEELLYGKHPATFGPFHKDIIAGHNGTFKISKDAGEPIGINGALHDGQSHYFIDGSTERSGKLPILRYDTETGQYAAFLATADEVICEGAPYIPASLDPDDPYAETDDGDNWW